MGWEVDQEESEKKLPRVLPGGWFLVLGGLAGCYRSRNGLGVISSVVRHPEHGLWLHVSCSRKDRLPDYLDMKELHEVFVGPRRAFEAHVPPIEHVNLHEFARHLWARLDAPSFPDFRRNGEI